MTIDGVPEGHWMILDEHRKVLFHSKAIKELMEKCNEYPDGTVFLERKFSGLIFQIKKKRQRRDALIVLVRRILLCLDMIEVFRTQLAFQLSCLRQSRLELSLAQELG